MAVMRARLATLPRANARPKGVGRVDRSSSKRQVALQARTRELGTWWEGLPARYRIVGATSLAFVICNMDKVNMSVAILPMASEFGWSAGTAGIIQSSFFWGYAVSQLPGGWLASKLSGKVVLPAGVLLWSLATALIPQAADEAILLLCLARALVGLGEGISPAAATDLISRVVPVTERSRATAVVFGGLNAGSVLGLIVAPFIINQFGWESVFYGFGALGILWAVWYLISFGGNELKKAELELEKYNGKPAEKKVEQDVPWGKFLRSKPLWALAYTHFCNNWTGFVLLAWMPTYFSNGLGLDLKNASLLSILPPVASIATSSFAAPMADKLIADGQPVTLVRKAAQAIAFLCPAICMAFTATAEDPFTAIAFLTVGLGLSSFSIAGLYSNHADLSPRYASILLGFTNTAGATPGIIGVSLTGLLLDKTDNWALSLFGPMLFFQITGALVFSIFGSGENQGYGIDKKNVQKHSDV